MWPKGDAATSMAIGLWLLIFIQAYLLGSISWSYIMVRAAGGRDLRREGSGNLGALNAGRSLGWRFFVLTFLLDAGKGALAVVVAHSWTGLGWPPSPHWAFLAYAVTALATLGVILGHDFSIFLRFSGGKGLAAGVGALLVTDLWLAAAVLLAGAAGLAVTRNIYLSAVVAAILLPALAAAHGMGVGTTVLYALVAIVVVFRHRRNLRELRDCPTG